MHSFVPLFSLYGASSLSNFLGLEVCFGGVLTAYLLIVYYIPIVSNFGRLGLAVWSNRLLGISVPNSDVPVSPGFSSSKTGCYNIFVTSGLIFLFFCKMTAGAVTFLLCEVQIRVVL